MLSSKNLIEESKLRVSITASLDIEMEIQVLNDKLM